MWSFHHRDEEETCEIGEVAGKQESMEHIQGKVASPAELELVYTGI